MQKVIADLLAVDTNSVDILVHIRNAYPKATDEEIWDTYFNAIIDNRKKVMYELYVTNWWDGTKFTTRYIETVDSWEEAERHSMSATYNTFKKVG